MLFCLTRLCVCVHSPFGGRGGGDRGPALPRGGGHARRLESLAVLVEEVQPQHPQRAQR